MFGSQLLGHQPTFRGADFGMPEIASFGTAQFAQAVATSDSWEEHDGIEIVLVRSGEACWECPEHQLVRVCGSSGVLFPPGFRHRIVNGIYTPCHLVWIVFQPLEVAARVGRMISAEEISAIYDIASRRVAPVRFEQALARTIGALCQQLRNERLHIGSSVLMAEVRATFYSAVVGFWKQAAAGRQGVQSNAIVRRTQRILQDAEHDGAGLVEVSARVGCRKSHLHNLFKTELGMSPNDYRQRLRIKRGCERLAHGDEPITRISFDLGYSSSQYFCRVFKKYTGLTPSAYRDLFSVPSEPGRRPAAPVRQSAAAVEIEPSMPAPGQ